MKKPLLLFGLLIALGAHGQPQPKLILLCTGWQPLYQAWEQVAPSPERQNMRVVVEVDRAAHTLAASLPHSGAVVANLQVSERFYSGTSALGRLLFSQNLDAVEFSINRITGEGRFHYVVGEASYPAFTGICAPVAPRS